MNESWVDHFNVLINITFPTRRITGDKFEQDVEKECISDFIVERFSDDRSGSATYAIV